MEPALALLLLPERVLLPARVLRLDLLSAPRRQRSPLQALLPAGAAAGVRQEHSPPCRRGHRLRHCKPQALRERAPHDLGRGRLDPEERVRLDLGEQVRLDPGEPVRLDPASERVPRDLDPDLRRLLPPPR